MDKKRGPALLLLVVSLVMCCVLSNCCTRIQTENEQLLAENARLREVINSLNEQEEYPVVYVTPSRTKYHTKWFNR